MRYARNWCCLWYGLPLNPVAEAGEVLGEKDATAALIIRSRFDVDELARQGDRIDGHGPSITRPEKQNGETACAGRALQSATPAPNQA